MKSRPFLSIIIPAYNEENCLRPNLQSIMDFAGSIDPDVEILPVNDGSTDGTSDIIEDLAKDHPGIRPVHLPRRGGKARAVKAGVERSKGCFVLFTDADLSTPFTEFNKLLKMAEKGKTVVLASRCVPGSDVKCHQPIYRELTGKIFNFIVQMLLLPGIWDTQCGFKLFPGDDARIAFGRMTVFDFSFDVEILLICRSIGCSIMEVPVCWVNHADSKVRLIRDVPPMMISLIRMFFRRIAGKYDYNNDEPERMI